MIVYFVHHNVYLCMGFMVGILNIMGLILT